MNLAKIKKFIFSSIHHKQAIREFQDVCEIQSMKEFPQSAEIHDVKEFHAVLDNTFMKCRIV